MKIHHGVAKKAAKHHINLVHTADGTQVSANHADLAESIIGNNPKEVLAQALKALGYKSSRASGKKAKAKKAAVTQNKSVVKRPYKEAYRTKGSGQGCGDRLDVAMKDALEGDEAAMVKIAKSNNVPFVWQVLNKGLQRMNLTNVLRAIIKRGGKVDVMGKTIASL